MVIRTGDDDNLSEKLAHCFVCGEEVKYPHISWKGFGSAGPLHDATPEFGRTILLCSRLCAENLATNLSRDAAEVARVMAH